MLPLLLVLLFLIRSPWHLTLDSFQWLGQSVTSEVRAARLQNHRRPDKDGKEFHPVPADLRMSTVNRFRALGLGFRVLSFEFRV